MYITPEDLVKSLNLFIQHKQLHGAFKQQVIDVIERDRSYYTYEVLAELAIIYATEMDDTYKEQFFSKFMSKFSKEIQYLQEDTLYKILWSFIKAGRLIVKEDVYEWVIVKKAILERIPQMSPKVITDILVLSTMAKEVDTLSSQTGDLDFWEAVEPSLIFKLKEMDLDSLLNLMWSALEIERGSAIFNQQIESEITKRILKIQDDEFQTLLACFINDKGDK